MTEATARPLDGVRVADFSWFGAGPIAGRTLADFGAEVIRVESEARVDGLRLTQPQKPGKSGYNVGAYFNNYNAGKASFLLNMGAEGARDVALRLIERSDIFLSNLTPRVIERWGLTYEELCAVNPQIIAAYQPMQGTFGPHRDFLGFGAVLTPVTGISHLSGEPQRRPVGIGTNYPDYVVNPGHTVLAILAALRHRRRTGNGQRIELAQLESVAATMGPALLDYTANGCNQIRKGNASSWMAPHGIYRCRDGKRGAPHPDGSTIRERWIAIAIRSDAEWAALCGAAQRRVLRCRRPLRNPARPPRARGRPQRRHLSMDRRRRTPPRSPSACSLSASLPRSSRTPRTCATTTATSPNAASTSTSTTPKPASRSTTARSSSCTAPPANSPPPPPSSASTPSPSPPSCSTTPPKKPPTSPPPASSASGGMPGPPPDRRRAGAPRVAIDAFVTVNGEGNHKGCPYTDIL